MFAKKEYDGGAVSDDEQSATMLTDGVFSCYGSSAGRQLHRLGRSDAALMFIDDDAIWRDMRDKLRDLDREVLRRRAKRGKSPASPKQKQGPTAMLKDDGEGKEKTDNTMENPPQRVKSLDELGEGNVGNYISRIRALVRAAQEDKDGMPFDSYSSKLSKSVHSEDSGLQVEFGDRASRRNIFQDASDLSSKAASGSGSLQTMFPPGDKQEMEAVAFEQLMQSLDPTYAYREKTERRISDHFQEDEGKHRMSRAA